MGMGRKRGRTPKPSNGDLTDLEMFRRSRDWSYQDLTDHIEVVTGHRRNQDCWRKICQGITGEPQATTKAILDQFLERMAS